MEADRLKLAISPLQKGADRTAASRIWPRIESCRVDASPAVVIVHVCGAVRAPPPDVNAA